MLAPGILGTRDEYNKIAVDFGKRSFAVLQVNMLAPGILGTRDEYGQRYCGGKQVFIARGLYDWRNSSNLAELNAVLQKHLLIRRLKKDVLQDLPAKLRQRIPIEVDPECVKVQLLVNSSRRSEEKEKEKKRVHLSVLILREPGNIPDCPNRRSEPIQISQFVS